MKNNIESKNSPFKIKVCGMTEASNLQEVQRLNPDVIGFIFYPGSRRYVGKWRSEKLMQAVKQIPLYIKRCGVFVDNPLADILEAVKSFELDMVQLHGDESPAFCQGLKTITNLKIIKAFGVHENFDFELLSAYPDVVDYFLFDTSSEQKGGSGKSFDWELLKSYNGSTPYFLSGGIGLEALEKLAAITDERCIAVDVNSKLESSPGVKDIKLLKEFMSGLADLQQ